METSLTKKIVLITGGAKRVGASICRLLHANGASLMIHYRSSANEARSLQAELNLQRPNSVAIIQGDLLNLSVLPSIVQETIKHFGQLDVLINNASSYYPTEIGDIKDEQWQDLMGSNLKAPLFLAQAAAIELRKQQGCIINITDMHVVAPGPVMWPEDNPQFDELYRQRVISQTLLKRIGEPNDIAKAVKFLIQDAPFITGQIIAVDGGRSLNL